MAATRLRAHVVRRPSLPLTAQDEHDLLLLRESPSYRRALQELAGDDVASTDISEAALLHAVFEAGLAAVRRIAEQEGYEAIAAEQATDIESRRAQARRRRPTWADEK